MVMVAKVSHVHYKIKASWNTPIYFMSIYGYLTSSFGLY